MNSLYLPARLRFMPAIAVGAPSPGDAWTQGGQAYSNPNSNVAPGGAKKGIADKAAEAAAEAQASQEGGYATSRVDDPPPAAYVPPKPAPQAPAPQAPAPAAASSALVLPSIPWRTVGFAAAGVVLALVVGYVVIP